MLKVSNIVKKYGEKTVLNNLELFLSSNEIVAIVGENGSGKSTLFKIILNLIRQYQGHVEIEENKKVVGFVDGISFLPNLTGKENLYAFTDYNPKIFDEVIEKLNMQKYIDLKYKHYSMGMKQRLGLAFVLVQDADILILDEPFNALDTMGIIEFEKIIKEEKRKGKSIIIATHYLADLARYCDKILLLKNGQISEDLLISKNACPTFIVEFLQTINQNEIEKVLGKQVTIIDNQISFEAQVTEIPKIIKKLSKYNIVSVHQKQEDIVDKFLLEAK